MRYAWLLVIFIYACSSADEVPDTVLPPVKMEKVLWDVMKADEVINYRKLRDSVYNDTARMRGIYDTVFALHKITAQQYHHSLGFYKSHPRLLKTILDSIQKKNDLSQVDLSTAQ